ncbi:MAG: NAD(P)/FAD-dependent oxidoreductase [Acidimicrobiia bacterium]|nr:NAD(P)/FAD-dependent oxidoreductase [Acidimicrobiia bacterium]
MAQSERAREITDWLDTFSASLARGDVAATMALFHEESYWRDLIAFTWNIVTCEGRPSIESMLAARLAAVKPGSWSVEGEPAGADGVTEAFLTLETERTRGNGYVRLRDRKCWTLLTAATELKGHEERRGDSRPRGVDHGAFRDRQTWLDRRTEELSNLGRTRQPYCLIVGGGQAGIMLAARLKQLDVPTIVIDKHERPGDAWRKRYKSLCLHDPVWHDHLPYLPFPESWPVFSPKDKIADWLEMYARVMELDYWGSTTCQQASYDEAHQEWVVTVDRASETVVLRPKQLVLATGMSGVPNVPEVPGAEQFQGVQHHSSRHPGGEGFRGQQCVVVGSNNSTHDICADLWEHGAAVTMLQRSSTMVARSELMLELVLDGLYSESAVRVGITANKADIIFASIPYRIMAELQKPAYAEMAKRDAALYGRLRNVGFLLDFGDDDSGLFMKYLRRGSGYYIDVGASELVADGRIKLRSGVEVKELKARSAVLSDGTELPADLIVYATGYGSMNGWAAQLISQEVADRVGKCWGLGSNTTKDPGPWEGELRNMWKPTHQPGLWFHGGNLAQSRYYSSFLALQLKARLEGIDTPVYGMTPVHHTS